MAQAIACDMCGNETATTMQTNLNNGDAIAIGDSCMLPFYLTVVQTMVAEIPADTLIQYGEALKPVLDLIDASYATAIKAAAMDEDPVTGDTTDYRPTGEEADRV